MDTKLAGALLRAIEHLFSLIPGQSKFGNVRQKKNNNNFMSNLKVRLERVSVYPYTLLLVTGLTAENIKYDLKIYDLILY